MSIKYKVIAVISVYTVLFLSCMYIMSQSILTENIKIQQEKVLYENMEDSIETINDQITPLTSIAKDWSKWDETYNFMKFNSKSYIKDNLMNETFINLKVNILCYVNLSGKIVYLKSYNYKKKAATDYSSEFKKYTFYKKELSKHNLNYLLSGIIFIKNKPMIIASTSITKSSHAKDAAGTIILGRFIDISKSLKLEHISNSTTWIKSHKNNSQLYFKKSAINTTKKQLGKKIFSKIYTRLIDKNIIEGESLIRDIYGNKTIKFTLRIKRDLYNESNNNVNIFLKAFLIGQFIVCLVCMFTVQKLFISKVEKLNKFICDIGSNRTEIDKICIPGNDEISNLAHATNLMLEEINKDTYIIKRSEERLTQIMEASNDGFWDIDLSSDELYLSERLLNMIGYSNSDISNSRYILNQILNNKGFISIKNVYDCLPTYKEEFYNGEHKIITFKNEEKWLSIRGKILSRDLSGKPRRIAGSVTDITENKTRQTAIEYLSIHDSLTGLFNRAFFRSELNRLKDSEKIPLSIIIGDVNGLKLANDAFGHAKGDKLLITIADILEKACSKRDIVARLGGDEFVIILPSADETIAIEVCNKIKQLCEESSFSPIKPSIALGSATKKYLGESIEKLFEAAEDRMYKNKLLESKSARHSIIALMERTLFETDYETKEHTERLEHLAVSMGRYLKLPSNVIDELKLLSKLHDIGKVAININILTKPGPLTEPEWKLIRQHSEIGYRMALTSQDLVPIAESILSHHEKWDGSGYPRGIKGTEIPLLARILSIVDAYDVITHERPYKEAFTHEYAIAEIKKCAGTHFDPELVQIFIKMIAENDISFP